MLIVNGEMHCSCPLDIGHQATEKQVFPVGIYNIILCNYVEDPIKE